MLVALALLLSAAFGAGDQYLGSFSMHPWMADVSLLSAPWLVLPFFAGCTQREAKRAALLGLGCTFAALIGYGLMTLSPFEQAHLTTTSVAGFIRSSQRVFLGGLLTGPLFAWLGHRWRFGHAWWAAAATAAALCLEPLARIEAGQAIRSSTVLLAEVAAGLTLMVLFAARSFTTK
jgi:hypothetical protein